ncbi:MAG: phosphonate ABC transporter, permease protein PhnE [Bacteroidota bacterium]|jgi:phosphonate transport system permease protein
MSLNISSSLETSKDSVSLNIQSFIIDIILTWYILITSHRIVGSTLFTYQVSSSFYIQLSYIFTAISLSILLFFTKCSIGRLTLGLEQSDLQKKISKHLSWIVFSLSIISGWIITKISPIDFFSQQGLNGAGNIFYALITPELSIIDIALKALVETIYIALIATIIALPFSFVLGFLSARTLMNNNLTSSIIYNIVRITANFSRSIEPLIWAIIFSVWVGIGPFAGMLALMVHTVASLTKQYSEQIEDIDNGPIEAIEATGAHPLQVIYYAIIPQIVLPFLSFTIYRWDINVRMATIIGLVGGGGIGTMLMQYQGLAQWHEVGLIILMIALVVWVMDYISARVREVLR